MAIETTVTTAPEDASEDTSNSGSVIDSPSLFGSRAEIQVAASPESVYSVVSDLARSGEWSPECRGGEWVGGPPSAVGTVFRGRNERADDVVGWAPVVRGTWYTEAEVVAAEPGRTFRWAMRTADGRRQESVWGFDVAPGGAEGTATLVHHFRMGRATEGIRSITAELDEPARRRFVAEWGAKVEADLAATVRRVKRVIEQQG
ncbi:MULTISPECIES: SRPBCC family protein [unclassified Streptomyces]|uniref:SRPBCC family protein n=1 Tax=unclassified Streptomyces TaxID=2593676 RepID=UPI00136CCAD4|nr:MULTISPECIES: SRPBCC family protein [unclassified Streptomyces]MCW5253049.1 SRPBCC family protein [Streptomyces sp. SHP 1-2]MYU20811.1 SRPBCC family protein [Streptomyces sp. SID8352]